MYTTYHFKSAADIDIDVLNAIKTAYKEKAVVITIEEEHEFFIPDEQKQFVRNSIETYKKNPELLINEEAAWKMVNAD
jgi:type IV secretory pathway ATPase VirB11/archaellum biosynthesis ATPase